MSASSAYLAMLRDRSAFWTSPVTAKMHALRSLKLTIPLDGALLLRVPGQDAPQRITRPVLVAPLVTQELGCEGHSLSLFASPDSLPARRLIAHMRAPICVLEPAEADAILAISQPLRDPCDSADLIGAWADELIEALTPDHALAPPWDPRISLAMTHLRSAGGAQVPLAEVAAAVNMSPSRLAHVWKAQVGMPIRAWVLYERLLTTMARALAGDTLSAAAHHAGFSDQPHFNRTAMQMIGRRPGEVMGRGKILQA